MHVREPSDAEVSEKDSKGGDVINVGTNVRLQQLKWGLILERSI